MTKKNQVRTVFGPLLLGMLLLTAVFSAAQENAQAEYSRRFINGERLYKELRMYDAAAEFRRAQEIAGNSNDWAQALYWVILTELALADYGSALRDMDELGKAAPNSVYTRDMAYHRARAYFNQGYFEDAMVFFKRYNDSIPSDDTESADRKAAAFFWMGESLYSMGQFEEAEKFYAWVITKYPGSPKVEISSYKMDLIKQKKIEAELLALLKWSHEESLRTSEDYQRKIRTYEYTLNSYQRRIAELQGMDINYERSGQDALFDEPENQQGPRLSDPGTSGDQNQDPLIDKAIQLESDLLQLIREHDTGGFN